MRDIYEFLAKGGLLMWPIVLCSVTALAIFLERVWALQRPRVLPTRLMALLRDVVSGAKYDEAETLCASNGSSVAQVAIHGLRHRGRRREVVKEAMEEAGRRELSLLERHLGGLGTIASIAPLVGLLGTVAGMIRAFKAVVAEVSVRGQVNPGTLANGIWEALITTAAGLAVAIPTFIAYRYLEGRIDRLAVEMEEYSLELLDMLEAGQAGDAPEPMPVTPASAAAAETATA